MLKLPCQINIRISKEEKDMLSILQQEPHNVNISDFLRASIRNIYKIRVTKKQENQKVENKNAQINAQ
jgi:hypothetical protein